MLADRRAFFIKTSLLVALLLPQPSRGGYLPPLICQEALEKNHFVPTDRASLEWNQRRANLLADPHTENAISFRIDTVNLNRITANLNSVRGLLAANPLYNKNASLLLPSLLNHLSAPDAPDAIYFQEIWEKADHEMLRTLAEKAGYTVVQPTWNSARRNGLQILVRNESVDHLEEEASFRSYRGANGRPARVRTESLVNVDRGVLMTKVKLRNGMTLLLANKHKTPLLQNSSTREVQTDSESKIIRENSEGVSAVVLAGDENIVSDYEGRVSPGMREPLRKDRALYESLFDRYGIADTYRAVHPRKSDPGYTVNKEYPMTVLLRGGEFPPRRMDYIYVGEPKERTYVHVEDSKLIFTQRYNGDGQVDPKGTFLTDHFGVRSEITIFENPVVQP